MLLHCKSFFRKVLTTFLSVLGTKPVRPNPLSFLNFLIHTNIFRKVVFIMHRLNKKGQIVLTISAITGIFLVLGGLGSLETDSTSFLVAMFTTTIGLLFLILATILNSYDDTNDTKVEKV